MVVSVAMMTEVAVDLLLTTVALMIETTVIVLY